jgi:hypothetical protein
LWRVTRIRISSGAAFDKDVPVPVIVEDAGVEEFEFGLLVVPFAAPILLHQPVVGKLALWILVEHLQVGVGRRGVEIVIAFLHVLAVIALGIGETE